MKIIILILSLLSFQKLCFAQEKIITTISNLKYKILKEGSGNRPIATDEVTYHNRITLENGTLIDDTHIRGVPNENTMQFMINGLAEGLLLMPIGSKYIFYIPSALAYGTDGYRTTIKPNENVIMEVELLNAKPDLISILRKEKSERKCLPSGSSLIRAAINNDGNYVWLYNVNNVTKIFDSREKSLVKVVKNWETDKVIYFPKKEDKQQYTLFRNGIEEYDGRTISVEDKVPHNFVIKDAASNIVATFDVKGYIVFYFDNLIGSLYVESWAGEDCYLIRPNKKELKLKWKKHSRMLQSRQVSPKHNYLVDLYLCRVLNLRTGELSNPLTPYTDKAQFEKIERSIIFNDDETQITVGDDDKGLLTFNISDSKLLYTIPIPADLPRIDGFKVIPAPNQMDFLYYLNIDKKYASGGLAYWVSEGEGINFCDPLWEKEASDTYAKMIEDDLARYQKLIEKEKKEEEAQRIKDADYKKAYDAYQLKAAGEESRAVKTEYIKTNCDVCQGRGTVLESDGSIRRTYINSSYYQQSAGYSNVKCKACSGKGWHWEKR